MDRVVLMVVGQAGRKVVREIAWIDQVVSWVGMDWSFGGEMVGLLRRFGWMDGWMRDERMKQVIRKIVSPAEKT